MTDLVVIVPSRGRPHAAVELAEAFAETCTAGTRLVIAVDADDPTRDGYVKALQPYGPTTLHIGEAPSTMVKALNEAAGLHASEAYAIGFMGDDHRPRTHGWDEAYVDALRQLGTGIVYGDDLLQGERLPTQCAMTADIVRALGWMAPPQLTHLMVDNFWIDLGQAAGCIRYLPVVVEHMHPVAGKAEWDEGHLRVNDPRMYDRDRVAYRRFEAQGGLSDAAMKVIDLRSTR